VLTIGTAGHIDHGKSSLVKALTSIDPDRLPEEKERGMTIDLGFAWLALPSGETVGIVDVPGHKQFVHNVIPGLFGIDAVLLVVAADDGWMPQTEEHLRILDLLGIRHGIVVLNKVDLISDPEWLSLVEKDIAARLSGTSLADSPVMRVSTRSGAGIEELKKAIAALAEKLAPRQDIGKPRLPIDRLFVIKGSGVVVTGTLSQGTFSTGEDVIIVPSELSAHIRSLESYKKETRRAEPGSRMAVNLAGVKREDARRGDIVVSSALYAPLSRTIDTELKLLPAADAPLKNMAEVLVYMETRELLARVALIGAKTLKPGESCPAQLRFQEDVAAFIGERFIVRQQSPAKTIGGGVVLDPRASRFKLAEIPTRLALLAKRRSLDLDELILAELEKNRFVETKILLAASLFSQTEISGHVKHLISLKKLAQAGSYTIDSSVWQNASVKLLSTLEKELAGDTLKQGVSQAALQGALGLPREVFDALVQQMVSTGKLARQEDTLLLPRSKPVLSKQQEDLRIAVLDLFVKNPSSPPTLKELAIQLPASPPVVHYMIKQGELVELPDGILMETKHFQGIQDDVINLLKQNGHITIQEINQNFGFSRKYSVPLLTHLDRLGITRREGDVRVAGKKLV
jgi:selenocysteine-specific elongation factor